MCPQGPIVPDDLPELRAVAAPPGLSPAESAGPGGEATAPAELCDPALEQALRDAQWNVSAVARTLGLSRMTMYRRMKRAGLVPPNRQPPATWP